MIDKDGNKGLLAVDVGGGTQDVLAYFPGHSIENCPKMVMPSPTRIVAEKIARATNEQEAIFLFGEIMGGGVCARAAKEHIEEGLPLYATTRAALTFHDDLKRVEEMGVVLADEPPDDAVRIKMGDIDKTAIAIMLENFGVRIPDRWAVAVQDHGYSPGISNRETRFNWLREFIDSGGELNRLAFQDVPQLFTRMLAVKNLISDALVMDTGPAAILGALLDENVAARREEGLIVVNAGNFHVMCAMVRDEQVVGLFEHHTGLLDSEKLAEMIGRFREGKLSNKEVVDDSGHGCYVRQDAAGKGAFSFVAVTGPRREILKNEDAHMAVPYGDMMLTGCFGLLDAARRLGIVAG